MRPLTRLARVLAALGLAGVAVTAAVGAASADAAPHPWTPPVAGEPTKLFHLGPNPFLRGQHRGVDFAARGPVRAACAGRVVFAGRVAGERTVSVRCGRWRVSYAPLARIGVREGARIGAGARLGRTARGLHFGVRREGRRFGYVDPLRFLAARSAPPPVAGPTRTRAPRPPARGALPPPPAPAPVPARSPAASRPAPTLAPGPVWAGLALGLTGLVGAGRLRPSSRRQEGAPCRASSTSSSSPTIPNSP
jgi:Peptidase family M23